MKIISLFGFDSVETKRYLKTAGIVLVALIMGYGLWRHYMVSPWTRDARVRVQVVNVAAEIPGKIVDIRVKDNQEVKRGDVLFVIEQVDYQLALQQAEATVKMRLADKQIAEEDAQRRKLLGAAAVSTEDMHNSNSTALSAEAAYDAAVAARDLAKVNLGRTVIYSPVNGYVTNFELRVGDYASTGQIQLSIVDEDSFWVSGYFEETKLPYIHKGNIARIKLMGVGPEIEGHVDSYTRGIADQNSAGGAQMLPNVDPVFTWVRLAERIPVRIEIDKIPPGVDLAAGQTCTVMIESRRISSQ
jgi:multidrug resistance efflux pump